MKVSIEDIKKGQRKKIIRKIYYLRKKFRRIKCFFVTITFKTFEDYIEFDRVERKRLMENLKKNYGMVAAFSVVEAQQRGVPHVHMLVWMPKRIFIDNQFKKIYRSLGMTNIIRVKNKYIVYYLLKYMLKNEEKEKIKYKYKQRFINFYYKNKRKDKEWILKGLSGINKILRKYEIKKNKIGEYQYVNIGGCIVKYRVFTSFKEDGLYINDIYFQEFKEGLEVWLEDFPSYLEFLRWFECFILTKINQN
jgi:hypothetical protein